MEAQQQSELNWPGPKVCRNGFTWTLISATAFLALFVSVSLMAKWHALVYFTAFSAVLCHLALLPVVSSLPAPAWAKVGGYSWAIFDSILAVATLHGSPIEEIMPFRMGLHTVLAIWPLGVALTHTGFLRWAAIGLAVTFGIIPLLGDLVPEGTMLIGMPFIFTWLGAIAWQFKLYSRNANRP